MATEAHKFQVGIFVIAAVVIGVVGTIWVGATRFFEDTVHFVTYFGESVQGLDSGSAVKYRGVPAGRVDTITIAPDNELIEVRMDIKVETAKALKGDDTLRATLELSGITGLRYIEIDRRTGDALNQAPPLTFKPPTAMIPSARSSFKAVQAALTDVYDKIMKIDFAGISNDTREALQAASKVMQDQRIDALLTNLQSTTDATRATAENLQRITHGIDLAPMITSATHASQQASLVVDDLHRNLNGQKMADTVAQLGQLILSAQNAVVEMQRTLQQVDRTTANLRGLTDELRGQPSRLLFGSPPEPRRLEGEQP